MRGGEHTPGREEIVVQRKRGRRAGLFIGLNVHATSVGFSQRVAWNPSLSVQARVVHEPESKRGSK